MEDEAFAAEPLHPLKDGARFVAAARAGQGVSVNGGGQVEEGHALREVLGKLGCARRLAVEGEYQSPIEDGEFMFGKEVERDLALPEAFGGLSIQVECPGQRSEEHTSELQSL